MPSPPLPDPGSLVPDAINRLHLCSRLPRGEWELFSLVSDCFSAWHETRARDSLLWQNAGMQINGPLPPLPAALLNLAPEGAGEAWKVGQILQATAVSGAQSGQATLNINGALLLAQTTLAIQPGQTLQLEVTRLAELALLKILDVNLAPQKEPLTLTLPVPATPAARWQAGQIIKAEIIKAMVSELAQPRQTVLNIAGQLIALKVQLPVQAGQSVKLEILQPGAPAALRVLNVNTAAPSESIGQAMRTALPQQIPLPNVFANLAAVAQASPKLTPALPPEIVELARQVMNQLPTPATAATPEGLRRAMENSGVFFENALVQSAQGTAPLPPLTADLKGGLLSLLTTLFALIKGQAPETTTTPQQPTTQYTAPPPLPNAPPQPQARAHPTLTPQLTGQQALLELLRHVEGGVARIQLSQLASAQPEEDGRRAWLLELPLRNGDNVDVLQLRVERDKDGGDKQHPAPWTVNLAFDLENLGPVNARVTLAGGAVSVVFWAQNDATTALFRQHLHGLHTRLRDAGLTVGNLIAQRGTPPQPEIRDEGLPYVLLDVEA